MEANFQRELAKGLAIEVPAASVVAARIWGPTAGVVKTKAHSSIDFLVIANSIVNRGKPNQYEEEQIVGAIEVKARRDPFEQYEDTIVVIAKHQQARALRAALKIDVYCVVVFTDNVGVFRLDKEPDGERDIYRRDRGTTARHSYYLNDKFTYYPELRERIPDLE